MTRMCARRLGILVALAFLLPGITLGADAAAKAAALNKIWRRGAETCFGMYVLPQHTLRKERKTRRDAILALLVDRRAGEAAEAQAITDRERELVYKMEELLSHDDYFALYTQFLGALSYYKIKLDLSKMEFPDDILMEGLGLGAAHYVMLRDFHSWLSEKVDENTGILTLEDLRTKFAERLATKFSHLFPASFDIQKDLWFAIENDTKTPYFWKRILGNISIARPAVYLGALTCAAILGGAVTLAVLGERPRNRIDSNPIAPSDGTPGGVYTPPQNPERDAQDAIKKLGKNPKVFEE